MKRLRNIIPFILLTTMLLTGCGKSSDVYEDHNNSYTQYILGDSSLDISSFIFTDTTTITGISESVDYSSGAFTMETENEVLSFNIDSYVFILIKDTDFEFADSDDYISTIESNDLDGTWFTVDGDVESSTANDALKVVAQVTANVSITTEIYGIFSGQFASITIGDTEYSLFYGALGGTYDAVQKSDQKIIEHCIKTLAVSETEESADAKEETTEEDMIPEVTVQKIESGNAAY